jgi:hypothetical protein
MKYRILTLTVIFLSVFTTSCIDVIEEIWIKSDKSGVANFRIDAGTLGILFSSASDYIDPKMLGEITGAPNKLAPELRKIKGISEVKTINLLKSGKIGIKFKFDGQKSLNKAYYKIFGIDKRWYYPAIFKVKKHKLKRKNTAKYIKDYLQDNKENLKNDDLLKMINYKCIYHLPAKVEKIKNESGTKLKSNKTVIQSYDASSFINEDVDLGNIIYF